MCSFLAIHLFGAFYIVFGSFATYFQTVKSEVEDEDNEDSEDDNNDTDESNDVNTIYTASTYATPVKAPAYTAPVYNKAADPKY
jgi:hypothetical protein